MSSKKALPFQAVCANPQCGAFFHGKIDICPKCGTSRSSVKATGEKVVENAAVAPPALPAPAISLVKESIDPEVKPTVGPVIEPEPEPEPVYIAMRPFMCRLGDTIVQMKEGQKIYDQRAIRDLLSQGQPIRLETEAAGFITCPDCAHTFRPSPSELARASASSAPSKPTRAA